MKSKINLKNIYYYIQGNLRYRMYYSKYYKFLIRSHIKEQIEVRINSMNKSCYRLGSCIKCGCTTTQLQMCNKPCEGLCYPKMLSRFYWEDLKKDNCYHSEGDITFCLKSNKKGLLKFNKL
jgi:hypothetical protein